MSDNQIASIAERPDDYFRNEEGYRTAVNEMRISLDHEFEAIKIKKDFARTIFGAASLISGLLAGLQLFSAPTLSTHKDQVSLLLSLVVVLYLILVPLCLFVLRPITVSLPYEPNFDNLFPTLITRKSELEILDQLLVDYMRAIKDNEPINKLMTWQVNIAACYLALLVLLLVLANWVVQLT